MLHVLPIGDIKPHQESTMCPCGPKVEWRNPETGEEYSEGLVIHNSYDHREVVEQAEEYMNEEKPDANTQG